MCPDILVTAFLRAYDIVGGRVSDAGRVWENFTGLAGVGLGWVLAQVTQSSQRRHAATEARALAERTRVMAIVAQSRRLTGALEAIASSLQMEAAGTEIIHPTFKDLATEYDELLQALEINVDEAEVLGPIWIVGVARHVTDLGDVVVDGNRAILDRRIELAEMVDMANESLAGMSRTVEDLIVQAKLELQTERSFKLWSR